MGEKINFEPIFEHFDTRSIFKKLKKLTSDITTTSLLSKK